MRKVVRGAVTTVTFEEKVARRCWSELIPRRKPRPARGGGCDGRDVRELDSFSLGRAWDSHEVIKDACQGKQHQVRKPLVAMTGKATPERVLMHLTAGLRPRTRIMGRGPSQRSNVALPLIVPIIASLEVPDENGCRTDGSGPPRRDSLGHRPRELHISPGWDRQVKDSTACTYALRPMSDHLASTTMATE